jgi:hypothetical protein
MKLQYWFWKFYYLVFFNFSELHFEIRKIKDINSQRAEALFDVLNGE